MTGGSASRSRAIVLALGVAIGGCGGGEPAEPAPALAIDPGRVTVSGLSSGAYMAHQVHLALGERVAGAALFAGGPYGCAGGSLERALAECMRPEGDGPDVDALAATVRARAASGALAPLETLAGDRVFVFHGARDETVAPSLGRATVALYEHLAPALSITADLERPVAHVFPTVAGGGPCDRAEPPFLGACGFDGVELAFRALGLLEDGASAPVTPAGEWRRFDQTALAAPGASAHLDPVGLLYVPPGCGAGGCGLHVAFHGCEQSIGKVGRDFVEDSGYARWADLARVVVAFPQARASFVPLNPKACWDWWGYTGPAYDTRDGAQVQLIAKLIDALAAGG